LKNKVLIYLGLIAAAAGGFYIYTRKRLADNTKLRFKRISFKNRKFQLVFSVQNPTNSQATISALTGEVSVNNKQIADFSSFAEQKIAPKSESIINIVASPSVGLFSLLTTKGWLKGGVNYTIKGRANFDGAIAPFNFSAKLI
jgi:LEA14-like dessication related protein